VLTEWHFITGLDKNVKVPLYREICYAIKYKYGTKMEIPSISLEDNSSYLTRSLPCGQSLEIFVAQTEFGKVNILDVSPPLSI